MRAPAVAAETLTVMSLTAYAIHLPLNRSYRTAQGADKSATGAVLRLETDIGVGWGELTMMPGFGSLPSVDILRLASETLETLLLNRRRRVRELLRDIRGAGSRELTALAEMAFLDVLSRQAGLPLFRYLSASHRAAFPVSMVGWVGASDPVGTLEEADEWIRRGFDELKVKLSGAVEFDLDRLERLRRQYPWVKLRLDANGAYGFDDCVRLGRRLRSLSIEWIEQPLAVEDSGAYAELRRAMPVPIALDESVTDQTALAAIIADAQADVVKLKASRLGGLQEVIACASMAQAAGVRVVIGHGFGTYRSMMAELHAQLASGTTLGSEAVGAYKLPADPFRRGGDPLPPSLLVSDAPGITPEPDEGWIQEFIQPYPPTPST